MNDQPWLDGEVEVLDRLIDLWADPCFVGTDPEFWEMYLADAFMRAIRIYKLGTVEHYYLLCVREDYERGKLTHNTLKAALMDFDRFAKRVAERGEG